MKSRILVFIQFSTIILMMIPLDGLIQNLLSGLTIVVLGAIIGFLALKHNQLGNFNIRPDIKECAQLVTTGIYGFVRHPMYLSVLVMMLGVVVLYANFYVAGLYLILFVNIIVKLLYEESLWHCRDAQYREYAANTYRLIPYIF